MSAIRHALRFSVDRMHDARLLIYFATTAVTILWVVDYLILGNGKPESVLIFPAIFVSGLFLLCMLILAIALYRKGLSIRRYGELSKEEAAELHDRIADSVLGPKKN